jgi:hypothetical protein
MVVVQVQGAPRDGCKLVGEPEGKDSRPGLSGPLSVTHGFRPLRGSVFIGHF